MLRFVFLFLRGLRAEFQRDSDLRFALIARAEFLLLGGGLTVEARRCLFSLDALPGLDALLDFLLDELGL